jgi:protocatechuate 3,4-dioxygenase beta subunit
MRRSTILASAIALFAVPMLMIGPARAQNSEMRSVRGSVIDKGEAPVTGAVVYLKNVRSSTVKTYISMEDGQYRFSGLEPNVDYELHAEHNDMTSGNHTVSSFDGRKDIVVSLKLDKEKKRN